MWTLGIKPRSSRNGLIYWGLSLEAGISRYVTSSMLSPVCTKKLAHSLTHHLTGRPGKGKPGNSAITASLPRRPCCLSSLCTDVSNSEIQSQSHRSGSPRALCADELHRVTFQRSSQQLPSPLQKTLCSPCLQTNGPLLLSFSPLSFSFPNTHIVL